MNMQTGWMIAALCLSACAPQVDAQPQEVQATQQALGKDAASALRAKLLARIDTSRLLLSPQELIAKGSTFDESAALATLRAATGGKYQVDLDATTGLLNVEGEYDFDASLKPLADAAFLDRAGKLLGRFAPDVAIKELDLKHVGATRRTVGAPEAEQNVDQRLGSKVFAFRKLGGIRVSGNRLVASYLNDGRLQAVRGRWPSIDVAGSTLKSKLSSAEVVERALKLLIERKIDPDRKEPIALESFYELRHDGKGWVAVLRASALVTAYNHEGVPGRRQRHDFDI